MGYHDLVLDRQVRDWVLVPLTLVVVLMMLLRQYVAKWLSSGQSDAKVDLKQVREKAALARAGLLKAASGHLSELGFRQRKAFFIAKETGVFCQKSEAPAPHEQLFNNPDFMMNMMKQNISGLAPQLAMGAFVNFFFSGFILGKIPFPLSPTFRMMLQRGIDLPALDVTYFTSLSYYILLLFGLRGVMMMFFREEAIDDTQLYRQQMGMGMGQMPMETQKLFDAEKQALELVEYKSQLADVEHYAAELLRTKLNTRSRKRNVSVKDKSL